MRYHPYSSFADCKASDSTPLATDTRDSSQGTGRSTTLVCEKYAGDDAPPQQKPGHPPPPPNLIVQWSLRVVTVLVPLGTRDSYERAWRPPACVDSGHESGALF